MINIEYANAYTEVLEILKYVSKEDYNKIPKSKIELFETNANSDYQFSYNPNKTLNEQNVSKRAKAIIAILFREYWATSIQKEKILAVQKQERKKLEEEKQQQYCYEDLFKKDSSNSILENENVNLPVLIEKEKIYTKIFNFIKKIFSNFGKK